MELQHPPLRALRLPQVLDKTGISRSQLQRMVKAGQFPSPCHLTESGRISAWNEADVDSWLIEKFSGEVV